MKKYTFFYYIALSLFTSFLCACEENEGADSLVCFQTGGGVPVSFSYQDESFEHIANVINKSIGNSYTKITLFTQEELTEYNQRNATNYQLMPDGTYELPEDGNISFSKADTSKEFSIKIHPDKLFDAIKKDTKNKLYAIPLKLANQSEANNNRTVVYVMDMKYPEITIDESVSVRLVKKETDIPINIYTYEEGKIISNLEDIDLKLAIPEDAEEWLKLYNDTSSIKYQLLPAKAYELSKVSGAKGENQCLATVKVKRAELSSGYFILPVKLFGLCDHTALNHDVQTIIISNPNGYDDIGTEYDDGENIIFHVKLAIDEEGFKMHNSDMDFFRNKLAKQWDEINIRFNGLDKKGILKRNYIFVPDLDDIIVYEHKDNRSNWNVPQNYPEKINQKKYQCLVSYDCVIQEDEVNYGGGYSQTDYGMGSILVIHPGKENIGKFVDHFEGNNGTTSITHELGHFRGLMDTYWCELGADNNLITHKGFWPEKGNMMGACYEPLETAIWSDYEMYVLNATGAKVCDIYKVVKQYFADDVEISVTENGNPIDGFTLNVYHKDYAGSKMEKIEQTYTQKNGDKIKINATVPLFWPYDVWYENYPHTFNRLLLVEAISKKTGKKGYRFIPAYEVHKQGLLDKSENKKTGRSVFKATIDI